MSHEHTTAREKEIISRDPDYELAGSLQASLNNLPLRDYLLDIPQTEALESIGCALLAGTPSGYIEMATSTGKTAVEALLAEAAVRAGRRVLMIAPSIPIANQLMGRGDHADRGLARFASLPPDTKVRRHFGGGRANAFADIVVTTYPGLLNDVKSDHQNLGKFDVIIADECHRGLGEQTSHMLRTVFPNAFKIGLSATPDFAVDRTSEEVFNTQLYEFSLSNAIESGKTAPIRAFIYETDDTVELSDARKDFTERELAPLVRNVQRNGSALALTKAFVEEGRQGIIACVPGQNNLHARLLADLLKSQGIAAADIGGHLNPDTQTQRLKAYEAGLFDVLTFTKSLEEGWDSSRASFALNLSPTTSPVRTKQLLGRVLRKKPDGLDSIYVDFVDTTKGLYKSQYTAMHALDIDIIDYERVLGKVHSTNHRGNFLKNLRVISPSLLKRLQESQGRLLRDVTVVKTVDPLVMHWEKKLSEEGLPAELCHNDILPPKLQKRVEKAYASFYADNGVEPTLDELEEMMGELSNTAGQALAKYALRSDLQPEEWQDHDHVADDDLSDQTEIAESNELHRLLVNALGSLATSESNARIPGILAMYYGLVTDSRDGPNDVMTQTQIGKRFGVTGGIVGSLKSKGLSMLLHPSRSEKIVTFIDGSASDKDFRNSKKEDAKASLREFYSYCRQIEASDNKPDSLLEKLTSLSKSEQLAIFGIRDTTDKVTATQQLGQTIMLLRERIHAKQTRLTLNDAHPTLSDENILMIKRRINEEMAAEYIIRNLSRYIDYQSLWFY